MEALRNVDALDANHIGDRAPKKATDEYARLVRELSSK